MIKATCLLAALLLTGCAVTPSEMRDAKPYATFVSNKSADTLSRCIANNMETHSYAGLSTQINFRPIENGISIASQGNFELIDIKSSKHTTDIRFYSATTHTWVGGNQGRLDNTVNDIQTCL